ncbi:MAG: hypothetical protein JWP47_725 [Polaromonas sp.]|nr:hypothetical protein [Polaromonas sp.]
MGGRQARQLGVQLVEQDTDAGFGMRLQFSHAFGMALGHTALGVKVNDQRRLQGVGQPCQPFVIRNTEFFQQNRRRHRGGVGGVMELDHALCGKE